MRQAARIRVLLVESGRAVGGTERVLWELATRLPDSRFEVHVWLSPDPGVDEFAAALERADIPVERVAEVDRRLDWKGMLHTCRGSGSSSPTCSTFTTSGRPPTATCRRWRGPRACRTW